MSISSSEAQHMAEGEDEAEDQLETEQSNVTSHVRLKPAHSAQSLQKEEVLRRIRLRKRSAKLASSLQSLIRLPSSSMPKPKPKPKPTNPVSLSHNKWLDDPFDAL